MLCLHKEKYTNIDQKGEPENPSLSLAFFRNRGREAVHGHGEIDSHTTHNAAATKQGNVSLLHRRNTRPVSYRLSSV